MYEKENFEPQINTVKVKAIGKKKSGKPLLITALCCSILGGAVGTGGTMLGYKYLASETSAEVRENTDAETESTAESKAILVNAGRMDSVIAETASVSGELLTASQVYEKNVNSTVGITTSIRTNYFGYSTTAAASGSGFIISSDGYIITNHHVIEDAESITVTTYSGESYDAELVGSDESNDVAVLKIDTNGLTPVALGSSDALKVGEDVVAIGNPLGELTFSLTSGVVSALDREITTESATMNLIQTDCAINSGNSGGALFNMYGEVVGITNAKYSSSSSGEASIDNIGFAIPIDSVTGIVTSIIEKGYAVKPYIGVSVSDVSAETAVYGLPDGAAVMEITEGSPADKAGLQIGDIITSVNGEEITSGSGLALVIKKASAGDVLELEVYRKGETLTLKVRVDETKSGGETSQTENGSGKSEEYAPYGDMTPDFGGMFGGF